MEAGFSGHNPLVAARQEYVGQLTDVLAPYVVNYVTNVYLAAHAKGGGGTLAFQRALRDIPVWNANTIHQQTSEIQNRYTFLGDLIAACFVAYVKILSSVKLHHQKPNIKLKLPSNDAFVHKVYIHTAREFYATPALVKADRAVKVGIVKGAVEASVRDMLPIEDILKAYLGNTVDAEDNTMNPGEFADAEDAFAAPPPAFGSHMPHHPSPHPSMHPSMHPSPQPSALGQLQAALAHQPAAAAPDAVPMAPALAPSAEPAPPAPELPLFVSEQHSSPRATSPRADDKHISLGAGGHTNPPGQPRHSQALFSDAEDDF